MKNNLEQQNSQWADADIFKFLAENTVCLSSQQISLLFGVSINNCNSYVTMQANKILYINYILKENLQTACDTKHVKKISDNVQQLFRFTMAMLTMCNSQKLGLYCKMYTGMLTT